MITIVLHFGMKRKWKTPMLLSQCFDGIHPELMPYFNDYKIHVVNVAYLTDEQLNAYKSDFRIAAEYFVQAHRTGEYTPRPQSVRHVHDTLQMMRVLTNDGRFEKALAEGTAGRDVTMTDMLSKIENRGIERGIQLGEERGRSEGIALGEARGLQRGMLNTLFGLVRDDILTAQIAADRASLSLADFTAKMAEYEASIQA